MYAEKSPAAVENIEHIGESDCFQKYFKNKNTSEQKKKCHIRRQEKNRYRKYTVEKESHHDF